MTKALDDLAADLSNAFTGDLAHLRDRLVFGHWEDSLSLAEILTAEQQAAIVDAFCSEHGQTPALAVMSIWSKWYFGMVLPPYISANIVLGRMPACGVDDIRLILQPDCKISAAVVTGVTPVQALPLPGCALEPLVDRLVAPFIERYHQQTGVTRRVLWSNAGTLIEGVVRHLEKIGCSADLIAACDAYLARTHLADGTRNPLHLPVVYLDMPGESGRRRRICCLRYMLPDEKLCCACPRDGTAAKIKAHMRALEGAAL